MDASTYKGTCEHIDLFTCEFRTLDEAGIGIPFPQQDVHLDESLIKALSN
jgi:hypothetical protein